MEKLLEKTCKICSSWSRRSAIKSIAFNATENDLGDYLLKKNNKSFNIAGKLSPNEWKGQSNVEFIIDDILLRLSKTRSHRLSVRTVGFHPTKRGSIPWTANIL